MGSTTTGGKEGGKDEVEKSNSKKGSSCKERRRQSRHGTNKRGGTVGPRSWRLSLVLLLKLGMST